ncbi:MAG: LysM peptidoglycan-binding domain-containing protein [Acidimicrobiales bacterium]
MVALLRPHPVTPAVAGHRPLRLVVDNTSSQTKSGRSGRIEQESAPASSLPSEFDVRAVATMVVAVALVVFAAIFAIRVMQGSPSVAVDSVGDQGTSQSAIVGSSVANISDVGDQIVLAQPGDSMWSIAQAVAPGSDPRPVVATLIEANGGDSVQIGQQIVIPKQLLD